MATKRTDSNPQSKSADIIITYSEAGRQIGKTRETIRRWAKDGLIPMVRHPSGAPGIRQSDLDRLYGVAKKLREATATN